MRTLWSKFLSLLHSGTTSLKREEMRLLGELVLRVEGIEHHLTDGENDDDAVNKYAPALTDHVGQVNDALSSPSVATFDTNGAVNNNGPVLADHLAQVNRALADNVEQVNQALADHLAQVNQTLAAAKVSNAS